MIDQEFKQWDEREERGYKDEDGRRNKDESGDSIWVDNNDEAA